MEFIRTEGNDELKKALASCLNTALEKNEPIVWLVPGGSNIKVAIEIMKNLKQENIDLLTIVLTDERFGPIGHKDSNYHQLMEGGFNPNGAKFTDLLTGSTFEDTIKAGNVAMSTILTSSNTVIGYFGMGPDGHIAGILPNSPAAVSDKIWMIGYNGGQFQRFTLTPYALSHITQAFVGAYGNEKLTALTNLHDKMLPITDQPAQILRHIPEVLIFNDQIGD